MAGLSEVNAPCGVGRWNAEIRRESGDGMQKFVEFRNGMQDRRNAKIQDSETTKQSIEPVRWRMSKRKKAADSCWLLIITYFGNIFKQRCHILW